LRVDEVHRRRGIGGGKQEQQQAGQSHSQYGGVAKAAQALPRAADSTPCDARRAPDSPPGWLQPGSAAAAAAGADSVFIGIHRLIHAQCRLAALSEHAVDIRLELRASICCACEKHESYLKLRLVFPKASFFL
jgi:hypothetical protein